MGLAGRIARTAAALAAIAAFLTALAPGAGAARSGPTPASADAVHALFSQLNSIRRSNGLPPFRLSRDLTTAAVAHASSMGRRGYFSHDFEGGTPFGSWITRYYSPAGRWTAGENILWATRPMTAKQAVSMWMNSAGHRENILRASYREIGIGAVNVDGAPGVYGGMDVTIAVTDFGARG